MQIVDTIGLTEAQFPVSLAERRMLALWRRLDPDTQGLYTDAFVCMLSDPEYSPRQHRPDLRIVGDGDE